MTQPIPARKLIVRIVFMSYVGILMGVGAEIQDVKIAVDFRGAAAKKVQPRAAGINLCWLLDSDLHRKQEVSTGQALADLGVGALRFPYGHLADNYLWHTPGDRSGHNQLRPKVASLSQAPAGWPWAVKSDGSMPDAMDFNEYIALCRRIDAKPLVCVNVLSFKYPKGPSYQELKDSAVAWVSYAKKNRGQVAFWQIGNEVDHSSELLPMNEYVALYQDFALAMKKADPSAKTGPGILSSPAYYREVAKACPTLVDFASVHQYAWGWKNVCDHYEGWRDCKDSFDTNIEQAAKTLKSAGLPDVKLLVTETGVTGGPKLGETNNTYKALWCFEVLMNQLIHPAVEYSFYWGTHSPWDFTSYDQDPVRDVSVALRLRTNARTPTGEIIHLINKNLLEEFVPTERVVGTLRCYAMRSADRTKQTIFLLNKDDHSASVHLDLSTLAPSQVLRRVTFSGKSATNVAPGTRVAAESFKLPYQTTLEPLSLNILQWGN